MKQHMYAQLMVLGIILALSACQSDASQLKKATATDAEHVADFIRDYNDAMVAAVNEKDFNPLEPYLVANTSFYHALRRHINELHTKEQTFTSLDVDIEHVWMDVEVEEYHVYVQETKRVQTSGQQVSEVNDLNYIVTMTNDRLRIVTIKQR